MFRMIVKPFNFLKTTYSVAIWVVFLLFSIATAQAASVSLAWDASTSSGVSGYKLSYGSSSGTYTTTVDVGNTTSRTIAGLQEGSTYYFAVKAYNTTAESAYSTEVSYTVPYAAPVASISATPLSGTAPLTVTFTGSSTGSVTTRLWNFGDGTTSTVQNPSHTYASAGTYTVTLIATGPGGSNTATKSSYISVSTSTVAAPVASFTVSQTSGTTATAFTFIDSSTGNIISRSWNFGDGTASTNATVTKSYANAGTYSVSLTVNGPGGSKTAQRTISVTAAAPVASFSANPTSGTTLTSFSFTDSSTGSVTTRLWNFGDGTTSTVQNPSHTYASAGTYTVTLTATGPGGSNTKTQTGYITVSATTTGNSEPVAAYNFEEASGATVVDASGKGNHGTITEATRTTSGKYGKALSFDGVNDWVTINDSASLDLTTAMTLEAWVYPTATMSGWQSIITKEQPGGFGAAYYLAANSDLNQPEVAVYTTDWYKLYGGSALSANKWVHLAGTYDGSTMKLYVNGSQVSSQSQTGGIDVTSGVLRIGGNNYWGEFFKGRIDEIRIYNRVLSASEIQSDMNKAVAKSSPPKLLLGSQTVGSLADSASPGIAAALQTTASITGQVISLPVYVDTGSASTKLVAGIYTNNNGHPGTLLAQGTLSSPKAAAWNQVPLPATAVTAGTTYWIAILSPTNAGALKFRDKARSTALSSETSKATMLTTLPSTWTTGTISANGPLSGYGMGY